MEQNGNTERLYTLINKINRKLRNPKFDSRDQTALPVTHIQWWILKILWEQRECSTGNLAKSIGVRPATMSQMLDRLEKAGLINRFSDVADARVRIISLTAKGENMVRHSEAKFVQKLAGPLKYLTQQELETLILLMEKLFNHFPQNDNDSPQPRGRKTSGDFI